MASVNKTGERPDNTIDKSPIQILPHEVLTTVFTFLDALEVVKSQQVCHAWNQIGGDNLVWRSLLQAKLQTFAEINTPCWKELKKEFPVNDRVIDDKASLKIQFIQSISVLKLHEFSLRILKNATNEEKTILNSEATEKPQFIEQIKKILLRDNDLEAADRLILHQFCFNNYSKTEVAMGYNLLHHVLLNDHQTRVLGQTDLIEKLNSWNLVSHKSRWNNALPLQMALRNNMPHSIISFLHSSFLKFNKEEEFDALNEVIPNDTIPHFARLDFLVFKDQRQLGNSSESKSIPQKVELSLEERLFLTGSSETPMDFEDPFNNIPSQLDLSVPLSGGSLKAKRQKLDTKGLF